MKRILTSIMTVVATLGVCSNAYSSVFYATGKIKSISVEGPALIISGLAEAGVCQVNDSGLVTTLIKDNAKGKAQYSMAFSAYMSDQTIKVKIDDSVHDVNNYCYLDSIELDYSAE